VPYPRVVTATAILTLRPPRCHVPADDQTSNNGALRYVAGSHRWPLLPITSQHFNVSAPRARRTRRGAPSRARRLRAACTGAALVPPVARVASLSRSLGCRVPRPHKPPLPPPPYRLPPPQDMDSIRRVLNPEQLAVFDSAQVQVQLKAGEAAFHHPLTGASRYSSKERAGERAAGHCHQASAARSRETRRAARALALPRRARRRPLAAVHGSYANTSDAPRRATVVNLFNHGTRSNTDAPLLEGLPAIAAGQLLEGTFFPVLAGGAPAPGAPVGADSEAAAVQVEA
jgi:ectoine hydroxylase-related dioxygenase (phytanoyl-CoA dioxygenase family)